MAAESYLFSYAQKQKKKQNFLIAFFTFVSVLIVLQLLLLYIIRPLRVSSSSMQPELSKNNFVFLLPLEDGSTIFSSTSALERGSLVTVDNGTINEKTGFQHVVDFIFGIITFQQYRPFESSRWGDTEIFRIVGMPGDTLYIDNYIAYIRQGGASHFLTEFELSNKDYDVISYNYPQDWNMSVGTQGKTQEISLKRGEYFLLGDNRIIATDSRIFGIIKQENIDSKVSVRYFPFNALRAY